ncbi:MAG: hypothetical protein HY692_06430 [Cyanobacteria bacterium NC_groundwater_1444_Ag_S-0.65um_54_12]|nr:hypothetical protein [Cyanobacteria bacterium NC_groundwater_1444_Ag_S-0.65um_54_12]
MSCSATGDHEHSLLAHVPVCLNAAIERLATNTTADERWYRLVSSVDELANVLREIDEGNF